MSASELAEATEDFIFSPEGVAQVEAVAAQSAADALEADAYIASPEGADEREASETGFDDLSAPEARSTFTQKHQAVLDALNTDPGRLLSDAADAELVGPGAALIDPGDSGGPKELMLSSEALGTRKNNDESEPIDLEREPAGDFFVQEEPRVPVVLPDDLAAGISLPSADIDISLAEIDGPGTASSLGDYDTFYANVLTDTDLIAAPLADGVEIMAQIRSPEAPEEFTLELGLPAGSSLVRDDTGGFGVIRDGEQLAHVTPAVAFDAQGTEVPISMTANGSGLVLEVTHQDEDLAYPIVVDPVVQDDGMSWKDQGNRVGIELPPAAPDAHEDRVWYWRTEGGGSSQIDTNATFPTQCNQTTFGVCTGANAPAEGLYIRLKETAGGSNADAYKTGDHAVWRYRAPGTEAFVTEAAYQRNWYRQGAASPNQPHLFYGIAEPGDYVGIENYSDSPSFSNTPQTFNSPGPQNFTVSYKENRSTYTPPANDPNRLGGHTAVLGFVTGGTNASFDLTQPRWAYVGGALITLGDSKAPAVTAAETRTPGEDPNSANKFVDDVTLFVGGTATDNGLGIKSWTASIGGQTETVDLDCQGSRADPCPMEHTLPTSAAEALRFDTGTLGQGKRDVMLRARDLTQNLSQPTAAPVYVDHTDPEVSLDGALAPNSNQAGLNLNVQATDGTATGPNPSQDLFMRSGVRSISLLVDGRQLPGPSPQACGRSWGSCQMNHAFNLTPQQVSEGPHDFKVVVKDQLGHTETVSWRHVVDYGGPEIVRIESSHALRRPPAFGAPNGDYDATKIESDWIRNGSIQTKVYGRDAGSGMDRFELKLPTESTAMSKSAGCDIEPGNECAEYTGATFDYQASRLPEGFSEATATAFDDQGDPSTGVKIPFKVDRTAPQRDDQLFQNSDLYSQRDALIYGRTYTLNLRGTDNGVSPTSGTREIEVLVDGQRRGYFVQPCAPASCVSAMQRTFVFDTSEYAKGDQHTVEARITDLAGNTTTRSFVVKINDELGEIRPESRLFGLEQYFQYDSVETGLSGLHTNLATGNVVWHSTPMINPGRGLSSVLNLTYNSFDQRGALGVPNGSLRSVSYSEAGIGWSIGLSGITRINEPLGFLDPTDYGTPGTVALTDPDGTTHEFKLTALRTLAATDIYEYDSPPGVNLRLRQYSNVLSDALGNLLLPEQRKKAWAITRPDGVTYFFDGWGYLRTIEDRNDNKMEFEYELVNPATNGSACLVQVVSPGICEPRLVRVVDAAGTQNGATSAQKAKRTITISYWEPTSAAHQRNRIKEITDHEGRKLRLDYNPQSYLSSMTQAFGTGDARSRSFEYATQSGGFNRHPQLFRVSDFKGQFTRVDYYGDDGHRRAYAVTNRNTNARTYIYGGNQQDAGVGTTATVIDAEGKNWNYALDLRDRPLSISDPLGTKTELRWDSDHNVIELINASGSSDEARTSMSYDQNGLLTSQTDPLGRTTELTYRLDAGVFRSFYTWNNQSIDADSKGFVADLVGTKRPAGNAWSYELKPRTATNGYPTVTGDVIKQTDPFGYQATATYNSNGTLATETDEVGDKTEYPTYDLNGLPQEVKDPRGNRWLYRYDEVGNLLQAIDPRGSAGVTPGSTVLDTKPYTTTLTYDKLDRLVSERVPKDSSNGAYVSRTYAFDKNDNLTTETDGELKAWKTFYTPMDRPDYQLTPLGLKTDLAYDKEERMVEARSPRSFTETAAGRQYTTSYRLDAIGRPLAEIRQGETDTKDLITSYAYDRRDNVVGVSLPLNNQTGSSAVSPAQAVANASTPAKQRFSMAYDKADQLLERIEDPAVENLKTTYEYDQNGNKRIEISPRAYEIGADPASYTWITDYDARDMPIQEVTPLGDTTRRTYTKDGLLATETKPNGVETAASGDYTTTFTYDKNGDLASRSIPFRAGQYMPDDKPLGSLAVTYERNAVGDPTKITDARGFSFQNTFLDTGQLASTERPSWWNLDWSGGQPTPAPGKHFRRKPGSPAGEPDTAVPVGGPALVERTRPEAGGGTEDSVATSLGAFNGATDFGDVDSQPLPSMLSEAAIAEPGNSNPLKLSYDNELRLKSTTPPKMLSEQPAPFTINYDADGRIASRTWPLDSLSVDGRTPAAITHKFSYDSNSNLKTFVNGVGSELGDPVGSGPNPVDGPNVFRWDYDSFDRRTSELAPGSRDAGPGSIQRELTSFTYDANGNVRSVETPRGSASPAVGDLTFRYDYDTVDRLLAETNPSQPVERWSYRYDAGSNLIAETTPRGNAAGATPADFTTSTTFDRSDRPIEVREPEGLVTEIEYDANGNMVRLSEPGAATDLDGDMSADGESAHVTTFAYDGRDLPWKTTVGEGSYLRTTVTEYDPEGQLRRTVNPAGVDSSTGEPIQADSQSNPWLAATHATVNTWGPNGLLVTSRMPHANEAPKGPGGSAIPGGDDPYQDEAARNDDRWRQDFRYDKRGRLIYVSAPHEGAGEPEVEREPLPKDGSGNAVPGQLYTQYDTGWIATSEDSEVLEPNSPNQRLQSQDISYSYDANGNQTRWQSEAVGSPRGTELFDEREIRRSFYPSGLLSERTGHLELEGPDIQRTYDYRYNPNRSLTQVHDKLPEAIANDTGATRDRTTKIYRDEAEREIAVEEAWKEGRDSAFTYDRDGNVLVRKTDGSYEEFSGYSGGKTTVFAYDKLGRETKMDVSNTGPDLSVDTSYYPSGSVAARTRQVGTNPEVDEAYAYRTDGLVSRAMREGGENNSKDQDYLYDPNGNRTRDERGDHYFNSRDQLVFWDRGNSQPVEDANVSYAVNGAGSVIDKWDEALDAESEPPGTAKIHTEFVYEGDRLKHVDGAQVRSYYFYDLFGNVTQIDSDSKEGGEFPPAPAAPDPDGVCKQRSSGGDGSGITNYCYDEFERLVSTQSPGQEDPVRYVHDGLDRRDLKLTEEGGDVEASEYSYVGTSELLAREEDTDSDRRTYDYGSDGLRVAQLSKKSGTEDYHPYALDALGSVEALEDADGSIEEDEDGKTSRYAYDPYGAIEVDPDDETIEDPEDTLSDAAQNNPFRFQGHYYDSGVQTYDMRAREYRPDIGRFLTADRFEQASKDLALQTDPLTQNRYAFAGGNPVSRIEWDGHCVTPDACVHDAQNGKDPVVQTNAYEGSQCIQYCSGVPVSAARDLASSQATNPAHRQALVNIYLASRSQYRIARDGKRRSALVEEAEALDAILDATEPTKGTLLDRLSGSYCGTIGLCIGGDPSTLEYQSGYGAGGTVGKVADFAGVTAISRRALRFGIRNILPNRPPTFTAGAGLARAGTAAEEAVGGILGIGRNVGRGRATVSGTGRGGFRVPDFNPAQTIAQRGTVVEVKNVARLSSTPQLRDLLTYSRSQGVPLEIFTNARLPSSGALAQAAQAGQLRLTPLPSVP